MSWLDGPTPDDDLDALDGKAKADPSDPREKMDMPPELAGLLADMAPAARAVRSIHEVWVEAGFTDAQAFQFTIELYKGTLE